jgi:hypothetical protein
MCIFCVLFISCNVLILLHICVTQDKRKIAGDEEEAKDARVSYTHKTRETKEREKRKREEKTLL